MIEELDKFLQLTQRVLKIYIKMMWFSMEIIQMVTGWVIDFKFIDI